MGEMGNMSHRLNVVMPTVEYRTLTSLAKDSGGTVSEVVRDLLGIVLAEVRRAAPLAEERGVRVSEVLRESLGVGMWYLTKVKSAGDRRLCVRNSNGKVEDIEFVKV